MNTFLTFKKVRKIDVEESRERGSPNKKWLGVIRGYMREWEVNGEMVVYMGYVEKKKRVADPAYVG